MSKILSLSQAEIDKAYMRGVLDMEHAVDAWFRENMEQGDASNTLYDSLMKAMHDGCVMSEADLDAMRAAAPVNVGEKF